MGIADYMKTSYRQNNDLIADRKSYGGGRQSFPKDRRKLKLKEADEESLKELRIQVQKEKRLDQIKVASMIILILAITLIILF